MRWNLKFLQDQYTIRNIDRDFREWHQGREFYALWAVEIDASSWLENLHHARRHMQAYLIQGKPRRAHITLFTVGFVDDARYLRNIEQQIVSIERRKIQPFTLELGAISSFSSAPYFSIMDIDGGLEKIRHELAGTQNEDRTTPYTPHLTIGLYNNEYPTHEVMNVMEACALLPTEPVSVNRISLMHYATRSIMSPLISQQHIML